MAVLLKHNPVERFTESMVVAVDFKSDEGKTTGPTGVLFTHNSDIDNLSVLLHITLNVLLSSTVQNSSDKVLHEVGSVSYWSL